MTPKLFIGPERLQPGDVILWGDTHHAVISIRPSGNPELLEIEISGPETDRVENVDVIWIAKTHRVRVLRLS